MLSEKDADVLQNPPLEDKVRIERMLRYVWADNGDAIRYCMLFKLFAYLLTSLSTAFNTRVPQQCEEMLPEMGRAHSKGSATMQSPLSLGTYCNKLVCD